MLKEKAFASYSCFFMSSQLEEKYVCLQLINSSLAYFRIFICTIMVLFKEIKHFCKTYDCFQNFQCACITLFV